jgi:hypothetical protein
MPLHVRTPSSPVVGRWRAPVWQRVSFSALGLVMVSAAFWPYEDEPYEPLWFLALLGCLFVAYVLRPMLTLHEDAIHVRGMVLSRVIPIEEVSAVAGGYGGLHIWWADGRMSEATAIGEQANWSGMPGSDGRRHTMRTLILATRDAYLKRHGLTALPDPQHEDERLRREFQERGWAEYPPPSSRRRTIRKVD